MNSRNTSAGHAMKFFIWSIAFAACGAGPLASAYAAVAPPAETSIALLSKIILDVSRREAGKEWEKAKRGETLGSGDMVKTGEKSIAIIKFKDNSLVRVRESSELTVTGTLKGNAFSKSVDIENGVVGFNIKKQGTEEEFRFTSPTSVASIRGTGGLFAVADTSDTLTIIDGAGTMTNRNSRTAVDVQAGFTGISNHDGTIQSRPSTPEERRAAEDAVKTGEQQRKLELELRDSQGKTKQLRIDFNE